MSTTLSLPRKIPKAADHLRTVAHELGRPASWHTAGEWRVLDLRDIPAWRVQQVIDADEELRGLEWVIRG